MSKYANLPLTEALDAILDASWSMVGSPRWTRAYRSRIAAARTPRPRKRRSSFVTGIPTGTTYPSSVIALTAAEQAIIDASSRFWQSPLVADLRAGRLIVEAERRDEQGSWSAAPTPLSRAFWQIEMFSVERERALLIHYAGRRERHYFANPMVRDPQQEIAEPSTPEMRAKTYSGTQGRPSAKHLYIAEMKRRSEAGTLKPSIGKEVQELLAWFVEKHSDLNPGTPRSIENSIRSDYHALKAATRKSCMK
jgi:hypothetical protein